MKAHEQASDENPPLHLEWSPELKRICLRNEAGELLNNAEEYREISIDGGITRRYRKFA